MREMADLLAAQMRSAGISVEVLPTTEKRSPGSQNR